MIGYEPQMVKEDIRKLYHRLADDFVKGPFEKVYNECEEYIRKYFSCWSLQFQMGLLLINHSNLAGSPERVIEVIERTLDIFSRVEKSSEDVNLAKQALQLKAVCYLSLQQPAAAIELLENMNEPFMQAETMLVKAYQMQGDNAKAIEYLQGYTYVNLVTILGAAPDYFMMYADQPEKMERFYQIFLKLCELFEVEQLSPAVLLHIYFTVAQAYVMQGNKNSAIDALEHLTEMIHKLEKVKFYLHGNDIFDSLEKYFASIDLETASPRNAEVIWKDLKNAVLHNPAFAILETEERFLRIKKRLEI